jgi:hypothetical protein
MSSMNAPCQVESPADPRLAFQQVTASRGLARRIEIDPDHLRNGLGQLVLTLVKLLHELLEKQAIRRMELGSLGEGEIDRLGTVLMRQVEEIDRLREAFGLSEEDLNLDLGPLGSLL